MVNTFEEIALLLRALTNVTMGFQQLERKLAIYLSLFGFLGFLEGQIITQNFSRVFPSFSSVSQIFMVFLGLSMFSIISLESRFHQARP